MRLQVAEDALFGTITLKSMAGFRLFFSVSGLISHSVLLQQSKVQENGTMYLCMIYLLGT